MEKKRTPESEMKLKDESSACFQLPFHQWRSLNRPRTGVSRCGLNVKLWGFVVGVKCECGMAQNPKHFMTCPAMKISCSKEDLTLTNDKTTLLIFESRTFNMLILDTEEELFLKLKYNHNLQKLTSYSSKYHSAKAPLDVKFYLRNSYPVAHRYKVI